MENTQIKREYMPYGRVLVVDDVATSLFVAKGLLKPYGLTVETALSGLEAVDRVRGGAVYDIIFMDHMMPQMDGVEAAGRIRETGYTGAVVALTASDITGQADFFPRNGFDGFISKPIDTRQLDAVLNQFIRDRQPPEAVEAAGRREESAAPVPCPGPDAELAALFAKDAGKAIDVIEAVYLNIENAGDGEWRLFTINVHGMKSALANIGEFKASERADSLERAGKRKDGAAVQAETPVFLDTLREIIEKTAPASGGAAVDAEDTECLRRQLEIIAAACADYDDRAAEAALEELGKKAWTIETKALLDTISGHILHSDFEEAALEAEKYLSADSLPLLRAVDGLDADSAAGAMGGGVYADTVRLTAGLLPKMAERLDGYILAGNMNAFAAEMHGLKKALKSIGASELGGKAARLESDALKGVMYEGAYMPFRALLAEFSRNLNAALPPSEERL